MKKQSMANTGNRGRTPRLSAAATVDAALRLLDEHGLDGLTMRRVAHAMDAQVGALYRYFPTKQSLLAAMAERMLEGCVDPVPRGEWPEKVQELARRMRIGLLAHRDGARVYAGTHAIGPNTLGYADMFIGILIEAGFSESDSADAAMMIIRFTTGHTLEEQAVQDAPDPTPLETAIEEGDFPHLSTVLTFLTTPDSTGQFEFGLGVAIAGLQMAGERAVSRRFGQCASGKRRTSRNGDESAS
jgi:TetR/AcrR family tetracycline transcriptional repressor